MILNLPTDIARHYKSGSQQARVITEPWAQENMYCPACRSPKLTKTETNRKVVDFLCPQCDSAFQLKASRRRFAHKVVDAAYEVMKRAILDDRLPHLLLLYYSFGDGMVVDLLLIPRFALGLSALEARRPLPPTARRAGWVGCNILLDSVPPDARIFLVQDGEIVPPASVRAQFHAAQRLDEISVVKRGWTLDVLTALRTLERQRFTLAEAYAFENVLARKHPENRNIRPKIRQQLQVLRDLGYIEFLGPGFYKWRSDG